MMMQAIKDKAEPFTLYARGFSGLVWTQMSKSMSNTVKDVKVVGKTQEPEARAPLESIRTSAPLELVCIDFWSAEGTHGESVDVLVITDHFTKLGHVFPCPNQTAKVVA